MKKTKAKNKKRALTSFFKKMMEAKNKGLESFMHKEKKYIRKEKGNLVYYKKSFWS